MTPSRRFRGAAHGPGPPAGCKLLSMTPRREVTRAERARGGVLGDLDCAPALMNINTIVGHNVLARLQMSRCQASSPIGSRSAGSCSTSSCAVSWSSSAHNDIPSRIRFVTMSLMTITVSDARRSVSTPWRIEHLAPFHHSPFSMNGGNERCGKRARSDPDGAGDAQTKKLKFKWAADTSGVREPKAVSSAGAKDRSFADPPSCRNSSGDGRTCGQNLQLQLPLLSIGRDDTSYPKD